MSPVALPSSSRHAAVFGWPSFPAALLATTAVLATLLWAGLLALDPYDTGRLALVRKAGILDQGARTANASRGRDPAFDGVLVGNSHLQLVDPAALTRATGIPFVSLTVTATAPREQFAVLDWFLSHRVRPARAIVIGTDDFWCTSDPAGGHWEPFPLWLYAPTSWRYALGLFRHASFDAALRRLEYVAAGSRARRARPDGYVDFEQDRRWQEGARRVDLAAAKPSPLVGLAGRFPQIERLAERLATLPRDTAVVLVRPPVFVTALPAPGTTLAGAEAACRDALSRLAASRARTTLIDRRRGLPENRDPANFFDHTHYRGGLARGLEREIAAAIESLAAPASR